MSTDTVDIVAFSRQLAESACGKTRRSGQAAAACAEGEAIAALLQPLGLARPLLAAARVYPLVRDGALPAAALDDTPLAGLRGTIGELVGLGRFTLPPDWQPGEALAVSQSEALRKMLLAVVSDAWLLGGVVIVDTRAPDAGFVRALDAGYALRKHVYNLYHVLNHLNLFGGAYLHQSRNMMQRLLAEVR